MIELAQIEVAVDNIRERVEILEVLLRHDGCEGGPRLSNKDWSKLADLSRTPLSARTPERAKEVDRLMTLARQTKERPTLSQKVAAVFR
jgi:hypothetical protein